jgi:PAS domain S-box-containing protein
MPPQKKSSHKSTLRKTAEESLGKNLPKTPIDQIDDVTKIVYNMEVHQSELEIQNEELLNTQRELNDSRDSYEVLYDFAPVGYLTLDSEGRILKTNLTTEKMIGIKRSKLTRSKKFSSLVSNQSQDIWHKYRLEVLECKGKKVTCELDIVKADKSLLSVNLETICIPSPDKTESLLMMAVIDITERKRADEALKESMAYFHSLLDNSVNVIYRLNLQTGLYDYISPSAKKVTGFTADELMAQDVETALSMIHPDDLPGVYEAHKRLEETGEIEVEYRQRTKSGDYKWLLNHLSLTRDREGRPLYRYGNLNDIYKRKKVEEALRESESRESERAAELAEILDAVPTPVIIVHDPESSHMSGNRAADDLLKHPPGAEISLSAPEDVRPRNFKAFKDGRELRLDELPAQRAARGENVKDFEFSLVYDDGETRQVLGYGTPLLDDKEHSRGAVHVLVDITDRMRAEEKSRLHVAELEAVFKTQSDVVIVYDTERNVKRANPSFQTLYGFDPIGLNVRDIIRKVSCKSLDGRSLVIEEQPTPRALQGENVSGQTFIVSRADGTERVVETSASPMWSGGSIVGSVTVWHDITSLKRAEEALRESQIKLRSAFASMQEAIFISDADGRLTEYNEEFVRYHRFKNRDECSKRIEDCPRYLEAFFEDGTPASPEFWAMPRALRGEKGLNIRYMLRRKDTGETWWGSYNFSPIMDEEGKITGSVVAAREITEIKKAEDALRESEARYRNLFSAMPSGVAVYKVINDGNDLDGKDFIFTDMNPAGEKIDQVFRAEIIGKSLYDFFPAAREMGLSEVFKRVWQTGVPEYFPVTLYADNNISLWVTNYVWRLPSGELVALFEDITDRKRAEDALRESEEKYRNLFENNLVGLFQTRISDGKILKANQAAAKILGYENPEKLVQDELIISKYYSADRRAKLLEELKKNGKVSDFDAHWKLPDGRELDISISAKIFPEAGYLEGAVVDITERKQAEETLRVVYENLLIQSEEVRLANDALLKTNKELEQFAYVTSHDLHEPLRSVTSFTQLLSTRYSDQFDDKAKEYFGFIVDASARMERLINDLLEFSRVGRMNTEKSLINCNNIVDRIIVNIKQSNKESGAEITRDNLPSLNANESTLTQLFQNLIANAVKFHKEGEPSRVHISAKKIDEEWLFSVKDNGIGINKKYFEKIFVIFQRLHGRYEYPGTGIGLAICKKIVELYGGKIWVESTEGEGATFYFTFPV